MPFWKRRSNDRPTDAVPVPDPRMTDVDNRMTILGHPVIAIGRKELFECGFEFCGRAIEAAFRSAGVEIRLDDETEPPPDLLDGHTEVSSWLWVNDNCLIGDYGVDVGISLHEGTITTFMAFDWDLVSALRDAFADKSDPDRNWHLGWADEEYLLILCPLDQLDEIAAHPEFPGFDTVNLTGAQVSWRRPSQ